MSKRANSKYKIDRRMGENIWGRPKSPVNKRSYGPGQHGQRRAKKLSDYGTQLQAKQKTPYAFEVLPEWRAFLSNLPDHSEQELFDMSKKVEPSQAS